MAATAPAVKPVPTAQLEALRRAAVDYVARATGCMLDGSEESLAFVDHYIDHFIAEQAKAQSGAKDKPQPAVLRLAASALGVYLGELAIARFGGRFVQSEPDEEAEAEEALLSFRVELESAPLWFDPIGMAALALLPQRPAKESSSFGGFALLSGHGHLYEPLHDALSRLSPVSEAYYYSLTGRFETLTYIVEVLLDIMQKQRDAASAETGSQAPAEAEPPAPR
jgi:hypothetical protein